MRVDLIAIPKKPLNVLYENTTGCLQAYQYSLDLPENIELKWNSVF